MADPVAAASVVVTVAEADAAVAAGRAVVLLGLDAGRLGQWLAGVAVTAPAAVLIGDPDAVEDRRAALAMALELFGLPQANSVVEDEGSGK